MTSSARGRIRDERDDVIRSGRTCDVGGDEHGHLLLLEGVDDGVALLLMHVAVDQPDCGETRERYWCGVPH